MALRIEKIVSAYCPICGWRKSYDPNDLNIAPPGICPACEDGKHKSWEKKEEKPKYKKNSNDRSRWGLPS